MKQTPFDFQISYNNLEVRIIMKIVLLTGATSGIGKATMKLLLSNEYFVIGVGSNETKINHLSLELDQEGYQNRYLSLLFDLSSQNELVRLYETVQKYLQDNGIKYLYALINNAGTVRSKYIETIDHLEYQFALNHMAGFILSRLFRPLLKDGVILFTGSKSHYHAKVKWHNLMNKGFYYPFQPYRQSKLFNLFTAKDLNDRFQSDHIRSYVVDPGVVKTEIANQHNSKLVSWVWSYVKRNADNPEKPAKTYLYLLNEKPEEGLYFYNEKATHYNPIADNPSIIQKATQVSMDYIFIEKEKVG